MKRNRIHRWSARRAFSMLELMLVLAIMGVLMAVAAYNMRGQSDKAKIAATVVTMKTIKNGLDQYQIDNNDFPPAVATLGTANILQQGNLKDGWKKDFYYSTPGANGKPYDLISYGPDQSPGTADDIDIWKVEEGK